MPPSPMIFFSCVRDGMTTPECSSSSDLGCSTSHGTSSPSQHSVTPPVLASLCGPTRNVEDCVSCFRPIHDQFVFYFDTQPYHYACLRCSICRMELGTEQTAFTRDQMLFCRNDYKMWIENYYCGSCTSCGLPFHMDDLVMRAGRACSHVGCFCCVVCHVSFRPGDVVAVDEMRRLFCSGRSTRPEAPSAHCDALFVPSTREDLPSTQVLTPKKEDTTDPEEMENDDMTNNGRSKRMRTSFKHHQLRTMKNYFNLNHNPDAKDLKQLAQKTGLTKRVLQVWFQNARAKYRRSIAGRDPSSVSPSIGGSILRPDQMRPTPPPDFCPPVEAIER